VSFLVVDSVAVCRLTRHLIKVFQLYVHHGFPCLLQRARRWVHWLRAMGENWYGHNVFINDHVSLAKFIGVVNVQSVMPCTAFDEARYLERLKSSGTHDRK
jgi:hypothetical protein